MNRSRYQRQRFTSRRRFSRGLYRLETKRKSRGEKRLLERASRQTEYIEWRYIIAALLAEPDTRKKGGKKCGRGRRGEKQACIFHAKSSSRSVGSSRAARALLADSSRRRRTVESTRVRLRSTSIHCVAQSKKKKERERALCVAL